jgi:purine-binding chemotaxis protein CheW
MASADQTAAGATVRCLCFFLHGQEYAADIEQVKETMTVRPLTRVFLTPPHLAGIINLRGDVVAVLDLALRLGLPATAVTDDTRIVIARDDGVIAGLLVDRMAPLRTLRADAVRPPPPTLPAETAALLRGVATVEGGAPVRLLDLGALLASERQRAGAEPETHPEGPNHGT